jgi:succinoglycan biosynthesis transport protein ExoP
MTSTVLKKHATGRASMPVPSRRSPPRVKIDGRPHGLAPGELVKLHHTLAESLNTGNGVVCQFIAPETNAGTEDVVYDLAYISAAWLGKRVLFVNGTGIKLDPKDHYAPRRREPLLGGDHDFDDVESTITRVVGLDLYRMTMPSMRGALDLAPTVKRLPDFLGKLREAFDLVVIAAPAASDAPMGVLLSRFVDGNILVLEAGRTRAPVALELRNSLSASGGMVVGAVLTRYQSAAPRWLRRWL